ncbi:MAG: PKD domain-containing protein [Chitinophagales bacterium]
MKRLILYSFIALFSTSMFAQSALSPKVGLGPKPLQKAQGDVNLENETIFDNPIVVTGSAGTPAEATGGSRALTVVPLGQAGNILTAIVESCNQVSYVPEINSVTFTHRQTSGIPGGSGGVDFDYSTDGGATWTNNNHVTPDFNDGTYSGVVSGNRYPNGTLYNPPGNTDPANAFNVFLGVAHDPVSGLAAWGWQFQGAASFDLSHLEEAYIQWEGTSEEYIPGGLNTTSTGGVYGISPNINNTNDVANDFINFTDIRLVGAVWSDITSSFIWGYQSWAPDVYTYVDPADGSTQTYAGFDWNIAFGPDGMTGYAVLIGAEAGDGADIVYPRPIVYKTTDGGASWSTLPAYNFYENLDLQEVILTTPTGEAVPYMSAIDITVDSDNRLHVFSETYSKSTSDNVADSLFFISGFDDGAGGFLQYTCMLHMTTTDGTDWTVHNMDNFIESTYVLPGTSLIAYNFRPQMGRNADGSKVFMSWSRSDTTLTLTNDIPDVWAAGYDIASGEYTPNKNLTSGTELEYTALYPSMSPLVIEDGDDFDYELPIAICKLGTNTESVTDFFYMKGVGFNESEFGGVAAPVADFTFSISTCIVVFSNSSSGEITSYSWDFDDGTATSSSISPTHTFDTPGTYNVCLTATGPGGSSTTCKDVTVGDCVSVEDVLLANALTVYPIPSNGFVTVEIADNAIHTSVIEVMNMLGETVHSAVTMSSSATLDLSNLADGNYMLKVTADNGGVTTRQITIAK